MLPTKMFSNRILLGGLQSNLIEYDLHSMEVVKKVIFKIINTEI